ncbi:MAG: nucleotidyltransferase family protein [Phycisphaerae bacterium]|nr:nucleotidyltransferase family protein [Phycisphaerae bacterium]
MVSLNDIQSQRERILEIARRHGASHVRIFGSVSRGRATQASDIDLLVTMAPDRSLLDRIALIHELEDLLRNPVDVVNERALHPEIRDEVLAEAVEL